MSGVRVGDLVSTATFGVGRLLAVQDDAVRVRYFTGPNTSPYTERVHDKGAVANAVLAPHTRVYLNDGRRWRIGRIDGRPDEQKRYTVAFPNLEGAVLGVDAFEVRWSVAADDPFPVLECLGGDSPIVYESRLGFVREWTKQRAAAMGVEGLLLASVELHRHQLAVVRRVAGDPIKRYLLADEVGLGKTIEAAALIWRFLAKNRNGRVLVLVPEHLRHQWAVELLDRFRTGRFSDASVRIRSLADDSRWPADPVDMLVIDEAHRVTRNGSLPLDLRNRIAGIAHAAEELLLLSATPVRSNEAGFLDLLHLLDPAHYHPDQVEAFTRRVEDRDKLALIGQGLTSDIDEFDLTLYAEQLETDYPEDTLLADLLASATSADDDHRSTAVARVREHLSEAYRLHRRVLRTRRTPEVMASFGVRGRKRAKPFVVFAKDPTDVHRTELLDQIRLDLMAAVEGGQLDLQDCVDLFREVAQRCGSLPQALLPLRSTERGKQSGLVSRLGDLVGREVLTSFDSLLDAICADLEDQTKSVVDALTPITGSKTQSRVVIATSFTESAIALAAEMTRRWGKTRIATHLSANGEQDNRDAIARWTNGGSCSILVVDASAEEGANLQIADALIHLDLPWESFRIEQRIGRCDRHAPTPMGPIESTVVAFGDEPYANGWLEFAADGCDAFTRSLSSLQYVLADTERTVQAGALREGPDALGDAVQEQKATLRAEKTRIVAHDALDQLEVSDAVDDEGETVDDRLIKSDQNPALTRRLTTWLEGVGASLSFEEKDILRIGKHPRPQVPFALETKIMGASGAPLAVARPASVQRRLPILRAGLPMVDAVGEHLLRDDRGIVFAMFRPWPGMWPVQVAFRAEFLISTSFGDEFVDEADALGLLPWMDQILQEVSPPVVKRVVMNPEGELATGAQLLRPYEPKKGDQNVVARPQLFEQLTKALDWTALCRNASEQTRRLVEVRSSVIDRPQAAATQVREAIGRRIDRSRARRLAGLSDFDGDAGSLEALVPERLSLEILPLGCGAIFIGDPSMLGKS
nr:protein DpdE [Mycobacterium sp. Root135]